MKFIEFDFLWFFFILATIATLFPQIHNWLVFVIQNPTYTSHVLFRTKSNNIAINHIVFVMFEHLDSHS